MPFAEIVADAAHPRGVVTARPAYQATVEDLYPYESTCVCCGGPTVRLELRLPPHEVAGSHLTDQLGGLTRFLKPVHCERCDVLAAYASLSPARPGPLVETPEAAELRRLREILAARPEAPDAAPIPGALFATAPVLATPEVLTALARRHVPKYDPAVVGSYERGRPFADAYLERHARGEWGMVGSHGDGDAESGSRLGPLASRLDQNCAAVARGAGSVRSAYRDGDAWTGFIVAVWTAAGDAPVTVICLSEQLSNT